MDNLKEVIKEIIKELESELKEGDLDYATGNVVKPKYGLDIKPTATTKGQEGIKNKKMADVTDGELVEGSKDYLMSGEDIPADNKKPLAMKSTAAKSKDDGQLADVSGMILAKDDAENSLKENRWLAIKKEEGSPKAKIGKGISSIHSQLSEVEKFVNWYSKLKTENGLKKEDYYKRTHKSLNKIKERIMNLSEKVRGL